MDAWEKFYGMSDKGAGADVVRPADGDGVGCGFKAERPLRKAIRIPICQPHLFVE